MGRIKVVIILCGLAIFSGNSCNGLPSIQKTSGKEISKTRISDPEPITILSRTATDPYTDSCMGRDIPNKVELFFFYEQDCELCDELTVFYDILAKKLPHEIRNSYPYLIYTINIITTEGRKTYERVTNAMGLDLTLLTPPLLIAGGKVFQGYETISDNIEEAFLTAGEDIFVNHRFYNPALKKTGARLFDDYSLKPDHVTVVYFYRIVCPDCKQVKPLIDAMPEFIATEGNQVPLDLIRINTRSGNNNERVAAFFEKYQVPDADRQVPIIFLANSYLSGVEPIKSSLTQKMAETSILNMLMDLIPAEAR